MRARSADVGLAVPMSSWRYTWRESTERISAPSSSASSIATSVLPTAVGPASVSSGGRAASGPESLTTMGQAAEGSEQRLPAAAPEEALEVLQTQPDERRAPVHVAVRQRSGE